MTKAISAGSKDIWLFGSSKGAEITGNILRDLNDRPELRFGFCFGVPDAEFPFVSIKPCVSPTWDPQYRRSGFFKYDVHQGVPFRGKAVVFNKYSDPWPNNLYAPFYWENLGKAPKHQYADVWAHPEFRQRVRAIIADPAPSYEDRPAGLAFDFGP